MTAGGPRGCASIEIGGEFIGVNGPLFSRHEGAGPDLRFHVEARHTNGMGMCHGGMQQLLHDESFQ